MNFEPGDDVCICLSLIENSWKQGVIKRNVVVAPDSFVIKINGQQYQRNKCDITFSPPRGNDGDTGGTTGNQHAEEQEENRTDKI